MAGQYRTDGAQGVSLQDPAPRSHVRGARWLIVAAAAAIGVLTLHPQPEMAVLAERTPVWCLVCGPLGAVDVLNNLVLFFPLGVGLALGGRRSLEVGLIVLAATLTIETLQLFLIPGRDASLSDVLANIAGGLIGGASVRRHDLWLNPTTRNSRRLAAGGMTVWMALTAATAAGLRPDPLDSPYYAHQAPQQPQFRPYLGRITATNVNGKTVVRARGTAVELVPEGEVPASMSVSLGSALATKNRATVALIRNQRATPVLALVQRGFDLTFWARTRSARWRLRSPEILLQSVFPLPPGHSITAGGRLSPKTMQIWTNSGITRQSTLRMSPNWSWVLVFPFDISLGSRTPILTGVWLAVLLLPISYWGKRAGMFRPWWWFWWLMAPSMAISLVGIPWLMGLAPVSAAEWTGTLVGIAGGSVIGRFSMHGKSVASIQQLALE